MNNVISCVCHNCGNEFAIGIPDLLPQNQSARIGDLLWCGSCGGDDYDCYWGMFLAGTSSDSVSSVVRIWTEWAKPYQAVSSRSNAAQSNPSKLQ